MSSSCFPQFHLITLIIALFTVMLSPVAHASSQDHPHVNYVHDLEEMLIYLAGDIESDQEAYAYF